MTQLFLLLITKLLISLKGDAYSDNIRKKVSKNSIFLDEKGVSQMRDDSVSKFKLNLKGKS